MAPVGRPLTYGAYNPPAVAQAPDKKVPANQGRQKGSGPKSGTADLSDGPCKTISADKLEAAVKNITPSLKEFNGSTVNYDSQVQKAVQVQNAVSAAMKELSGDTPSGMVNAGRCLIQRFNGDQEIAEDIAIRQSVKLATLGDEATQKLGTMVTNDRQLQVALKKSENQSIKDFIKVRADLIKEAYEDSPLNLHSFVKDAVAYNLSPVLFNAVIFQYAKKLPETEFGNMALTISGMRTNESDSLIGEGNQELWGWIYKHDAAFVKSRHIKNK